MVRNSELSAISTEVHSLSQSSKTNNANTPTTDDLIKIRKSLQQQVETLIQNESKQTQNNRQPNFERNC